MKRLASFIAAIALLATSAASIGCAWVIVDEPKGLSRFND